MNPATVAHISECARDAFGQAGIVITCAKPVQLKQSAAVHCRRYRPITDRL
uniref:Short chain dehydrogenase n=1 Tax=Macrostomum lignano TaxID=282301 RepID=A0A1I8FQC1_9PLAT